MRYTTILLSMIIMGCASAAQASDSNQTLAIALTQPNPGSSNVVTVEIGNRSAKPMTVVFDLKYELFLDYLPEGDSNNEKTLISWPEKMDFIYAEGHDKPFVWFELKAGERRTYPLTVPSRQYDGNGHSKPIPAGPYLVTAWSSVPSKQDDGKMAIIKVRSNSIRVVFAEESPQPTSQPSNP